MVALPQMFDATQIDPTQGAGQLPVSDGMGHLVVISASIAKETKEKTGGLLELTLEIIDGPSKGASGPYRLNLWNNSPQAAEIAAKQLSAICHVTGVFQVNDSAQLHGKPFRVVVGAQTDPKYTQVNKVLDVNGNEPGKPPTHQPTQQTAPQTNPAGFGGQQQAPQQAAAGAWGSQPAAASPPPPPAAQQAWTPAANGAATTNGAKPPWQA